jgi:CRP/FNR family transcriptional regulator, cyclic AMP receptor protein
VAAESIAKLPGATLEDALRNVDPVFPSTGSPPRSWHSTAVNGRASRSLQSVPPPGGGRSASTIGLLEMEPELGRLLTPEQYAAANGFSLPITSVGKRGDVEGALEDSDAFGALVLDGLLAQTVEIGTHETLQLIGPGALVPLERAVDTAPIARSRLCPTDKTRLVMLGKEFLIAAHNWPSVVICLHERTLEQSARLTQQLAICQLPRVQDRLVAMLRLLADSWGKMTAGGISLELPLTHETLGRLIGARRPTVSLALKELAEEKSVIRRGKGWLIPGEQPLRALPSTPPSRDLHPFGQVPLSGADTEVETQVDV